MIAGQSNRIRMMLVLALGLLLGAACAPGGRSRGNTTTPEETEGAEPEGSGGGGEGEGEGTESEGEGTEGEGEGTEGEGEGTEGEGEGTEGEGEGTEGEVEGTEGEGEGTEGEGEGTEGEGEGTEGEGEGAEGEGEGCASHLDCRATLQLCDPETRRCVDCLGPNDCAATEECQDHRCIEVVNCDSHRDCLPLGQVCNLATGRCVRCLGDEDCPARQHCVAEECRPVICEVGEYRCGAAGREQCTDRQTAWQDAPCGADEVCRDGRCLARECLGVITRCTPAGQEQRCHDGLWGAARDCPAGERCRGGACTAIEECQLIEALGEPADGSQPAAAVLELDESTPIRLQAWTSPPDGEVRWAVRSAPGGSLAWFAPGAGQAAVTYLPVLAGEYVLEAAIVPAAGELLPCGPAVVRLEVRPAAELHLELLWDTPEDPDPTDGGQFVGADLDLHLARATSAFFQPPGDLYFANLTPDWGVVGQAADNPVLIRDDVDGWGPEIIELPRPEAQQFYQLGVHYWDDRGYGVSQAEVRVWVRGVLAHAVTRELSRSKSFWYLGELHWATGRVYLADQVREEVEGRTPEPCFDTDGDRHGAGCAAGGDCAPRDAAVFEDCPAAGCVDEDGDRFGTGPACLGPDCAPRDPTASLCLECRDADGDGYGRGLTCPAPDCWDQDVAVGGPCVTLEQCADQDGDRYGQGQGCLGPDCNDGDGSIHAGCAAPPCGVDQEECGAGLACDFAREECFYLDGSCSDQAPCPPGLNCGGGFIPGAWCFGCSDDADCRPGQTCIPLIALCQPVQ